MKWKKKKGIYTLLYENIVIATIYPLHVGGFNSVLFHEINHHYHDELSDAKDSIVKRLKEFASSIL